MSISKHLILAVLSCCAIGGLYASESPRQAKKHYIKEQNIKVTNEGIAIRAKGKVIKVKSLRHDRRGIYVFRKDCLGVTKHWEETGWTDGHPYCPDCEWGFRDQDAFNYHNDVVHSDMDR